MSPELRTRLLPGALVSIVMVTGKWSLTATLLVGASAGLPGVGPD
jgi:hypothetical protein